MAKSPDKVDVYSNDNRRFRKAYIRQRLNEMKEEREVLIAERDAIDRALGIVKKEEPEAASPHHT